MRIYVGHSKAFDFRNLLYEPLRKGLDKTHELVFPHETDETLDSREALKSCEAMIAEVSHPSIGLGVEMGWADSMGLPIICAYRKGSKVSESIRMISSNIVEYSDPEQMVLEINRILRFE